MAHHLIPFMISATILTVVGVFFFALVLIKLNNQQFQDHRNYLKGLVRERDHTMSVVAREVHDNIKQLLYMARKSLQRIEEDSVGQKKKSLQQTGEILDVMIRDAEDISSALDPNAIMQSGLEQAFVRVADWLNRSGKPTCRLQFYCPWGRLPAETELMIFRVAQEAIQNVVRHAQASHIDLEFFCTGEEQFCLIVQDDGKGIPQDGPIDTRMRMGLRNMRQRAEMLGARLQIDSNPGAGTRVELVFPGTEPAL